MEICGILMHLKCEKCYCIYSVRLYNAQCQGGPFTYITV